MPTSAATPVVDALQEILRRLSAIEQRLAHLEQARAPTPVEASQTTLALLQAISLRLDRLEGPAPGEPRTPPRQGAAAEDDAMETAEPSGT